MSLQPAIVLVQPPLSKFGQAVIAHPIAARLASSGVPHVLSLPPHALATALWSFVVQRDCSGLRFTEEFLKDYAVPAEVRAKMGVMRPR